jgi:hypothetical protein
MTTTLIIIGLALFILRSQLLRVGMQLAAREEGGMDMAKVHASAMLGAVSGWLGLMAAAALIVLAFLAEGLLAGGVIVLAGLGVGILLSAVLIPVLGTTLAFGHHGGEGMVSVAAFNRAYGAYVALSVVAIAGIAWALQFGWRIP